MQEKTSSGYDILYPQTIAAQIEDVYSKDETITTATKALYGLGATATPNQVFSAISTALDGKARIQTGSYVGTGTYGASNPCSLTFNFVPIYFQMLGRIFLNAPSWTDPYPWGASQNDSKRVFGCYLDLVSNTYEYGLFGYPTTTKETIWVKKENNTLFWYSDKTDEGQFNTISYTYYYLYF